MPVPAETVAYAADASDEGVDAARQWIRDHGLTGDDVKLVKRNEQCLVIALRPISLTSA